MFSVRICGRDNEPLRMSATISTRNYRRQANGISRSHSYPQSPVNIIYIARPQTRRRMRSVKRLLMQLILGHTEKDTHTENQRETERGRGKAAEITRDVARRFINITFN